MIEAIFRRKGDELSLRLTGHAGAAEKGRDTICASASILAYTVAQMMDYLHWQEKMIEKPEIRLDEGDTLIVVRPTKEGFAEALHTLLVAQVGYDLLHLNYPQCLHLIKFGEASKA